MICLRCGATVPDGSRFCGRCGLLVSDPQESTVILEGATGEAEIERLRLVFAGDFDVDREIGRGGMGVIYRATEIALQRPVALKVLAPGLGTAPRSAERFRREGRVVAELEHPNIVPMYRVGQVGGVLYIAMKLVDGRALDSIIHDQGPLTVPVALYVLRAAGRALAYAHKRAIVHRDIKSANLLVDGDGRVLVTDFGVALHAADVTLTEAGAVIGTPAFMSPEQCAGYRANPQSDQYALGVVAFEMLAGAVPFESDTIAGYIHHHLHTPPPNLRAVRDDLPEPLLALVERLLAKHPEDRYATSQAMLEAIEALPFSEQDRRRSEETLRHLAEGADVPRVPSRELPRIADAATLVVARTPARRRVPPVTWAALGLTVVAGALFAAQSIRAREAAQAPPILVEPPPAAPEKAATTDVTVEPSAAANLRIVTIPATAEIFVDGQKVGTGDAFDHGLATGQRRIVARATGYVDFDTTITVVAGVPVTLGTVTLRPLGERP
jgi:serine/threonine-protein kinase